MVGGGQVVGRRSPAILSERDCVINFAVINFAVINFAVINFARLLNEEGVPRDAIHHEVSMSRWIFEEPHPAATAMTPAQRRRRLDLVLVNTGTFSPLSYPSQLPGSNSTQFSSSSTSPTTGRYRASGSLAVIPLVGARRSRSMQSAFTKC